MFLGEIFYRVHVVSLIHVKIHVEFHVKRFKFPPEFYVEFFTWVMKHLKILMNFNFINFSAIKIKKAIYFNGIFMHGSIRKLTHFLRFRRISRFFRSSFMNFQVTRLASIHKKGKTRHRILLTFAQSKKVSDRLLRFILGLITYFRGQYSSCIFLYSVIKEVLIILSERNSLDLCFTSQPYTLEESNDPINYNNCFKGM